MQNTIPYFYNNSTFILSYDIIFKGDVMEELKIKGIYKHFKGDYYLVEDIAYSSDDGVTKYVIYRKLYGDGSLFIREYNDFLGDVNKEKYPNVKQIKKFELQEIESQRSKF